jgi:hypothetical protein
MTQRVMTDELPLLTVIGPISEPSIVHIQSHSLQQVFVDHVITHTVGTGWMVAEDALDRYLIGRIERHTRKRWVRIVARGFLNPAYTLPIAWNSTFPGTATTSGCSVLSL